MECVTITTLADLNIVIDRYIRTRFENYLQTADKTKTIKQYMYRMMFETLDVSSINYDTLHITLVIRVRREMLEFIDRIYQLKGDEVELGKVEEYLTGYYIQAYLFSQL